MQNQCASIHNLENQLGQIAVALANKPQGTLQSDIENTLREQVLAVEVVSYVTIEFPYSLPLSPSKFIYHLLHFLKDCEGSQQWSKLMPSILGVVFNC